MSNYDLQETEKADQKTLTKLIESNCRKFHPKLPLPETPFFLKTQSPASQILSSLLHNSAYDVQEFSKQAAKTLLHYKSLEDEHNVLKASHLLESLDINKAFEEVRTMSSNSTFITIKLIKCQSNKGPISVKFKLPNKENVMEEGDVANIVVGFNEVIPVEYLVDDGDNVYVLESDLINIQNLFKGVVYMKAAQSPELVEEVHKKVIDYEVRIEIRLKLSVKDRMAILSKRNVEVEKGIQEGNESVAVFNSLMDSLLVIYNADDGEFESVVRGREKGRDGCCETCVVV